MFREMRRKNQLMDEAECFEILKNATSGVLALSGDDGYPYAVPMSYVYHNRKLIFHSAVTGHKIDAVKRNNKASFCITAADNVVAEEFTTYFRSVIVFGKIHIIDDETEKMHTVRALAQKYSADFMDKAEREIEKYNNSLCMFELIPEHITGKKAKELIMKKDR